MKTNSFLMREGYISRCSSTLKSPLWSWWVVKYQPTKEFILETNLRTKRKPLSCSSTGTRAMGLSDDLAPPSLHFEGQQPVFLATNDVNSTSSGRQAAETRRRSLVHASHHWRPDVDAKFWSVMSDFYWSEMARNMYIDQISSHERRTIASSPAKIQSTP